MSDSKLHEPGYHACTNSYGLYDALRFVMRLSPLVHQRVSASKNRPEGESTFEEMRALSTEFHETIHWWQHVGSSAGFLMSLSYPMQTQANYVHLKELVANAVNKKPIRNYACKLNPTNLFHPLVHTIVNNFYDIEYFRALVTNPSNVQRITSSPYFECVGHSYSIGYGNILTFLSGNFDPDFSVIPNPAPYEFEMEKLKSRKVTGFYHGSIPIVPPIGTFELFEGQARFTQLQYLHFALNKTFEWSDAEKAGMMSAPYTTAFELFLKVTGYVWPESINDPIVGLFLLLCDFSVNPASGFPMPLESFETFIYDVTPGMRFLKLAEAVAKTPGDFATAIVKYSKTEYETVGNMLELSTHLTHPLKVTRAVESWAASTKEFRNLMDSYTTFDFSAIDTLLSVLASHFISFNRDKLEKPEFFCWPGFWLTLDRESSTQLFERHKPLFVDKEEDDSIFPRTIAGTSLDSVQRTFELFYSAVVLYDLTKQWLEKTGPFEYDFKWLFARSRSKDSMEEYGRALFQKTFGIDPERLELVPETLVLRNN